MKNLLALTFLVFALTGCSFLCKKPTPPNIPGDKDQQVNVDARLLADCEQLAPLTGTDESHVAVMARAWSEAHAACASNHKSLVTVVKKAWNIPDAPATPASSAAK